MLKISTFDDRPPLPSEWLVNSIIPKGNCCIIGGEPKSYKTWLSLLIAVCLSSGESVLRRWKPKHRGRTLIYSPEGQGEGLRRRLYGLCIGMGLDYREVLKDIVVIQEPVKIDNPKCYIELGRTIIETKPDLLIMDPLVKLHGAEENDNVAIQQVLDLIRALNGANPGMTQIIVHHTKKGGTGGGYDLRGASAIYGWLDTLISISSKEGEVARKISVMHRDDVPPAPLEFYFQIEADNGFILEPKTGA